MPPGGEVGLGLSAIVLDGDPTIPKWAQSLIFGPCLLWLNSWIYQDASCYRGRPRAGDIVLDGDPAPPEKGHNTPKATRPAPSIRFMSIVAKRLDG